MVDRFDLVVHLVDPLVSVDSSWENEEGGYKASMEREGCYFPHDLYIMWNCHFLHYHLWATAMSEQRQGMEYIGAGDTSGRR